MIAQVHVDVEDPPPTSVVALCVVFSIAIMGNVASSLMGMYLERGFFERALSSIGPHYGLSLEPPRLAQHSKQRARVRTIYYPRGPAVATNTPP